MNTIHKLKQDSEEFVYELLSGLIESSSPCTIEDMIHEISVQSTVKPETFLACVKDFISAAAANGEIEPYDVDEADISYCPMGMAGRFDV